MLCDKSTTGPRAIANTIAIWVHLFRSRAKLNWHSIVGTHSPQSACMCNKCLFVYKTIRALRWRYSVCAEQSLLQDAVFCDCHKYEGIVALNLLLPYNGFSCLVCFHFCFGQWFLFPIWIRMNSWFCYSRRTFTYFWVVCIHLKNN